MGIKKQEKTFGEDSLHTVSHIPEEKSYPHPLVLVHGSWGGAWMWIKYIQFLTQQGFEVHALDLVGHGQSGRGVAGALMEDYENNVRTVVEELCLENEIIIGHSMSGLVALMYARDYNPGAVVSIDPSPSTEVQVPGEEKEYKKEYTAMDAGMPSDPQKVMEALPDLEPEQLMTMKAKLGLESGKARSQRKLGISVPKGSLPMPVLFLGGEHGESVPFGIGIEKARAMADYYEKEVYEVKGATHPGILVGKNFQDGAQKISEWLKEKVV